MHAQEAVVRRMGAVQRVVICVVLVVNAVVVAASLASTAYYSLAAGADASAAAAFSRNQTERVSRSFLTPSAMLVSATHALQCFKYALSFVSWSL
jgi:hypothetical protein